ncbi:MAG: N-6 DNA methylase, partial [Cetobacterium sp.]
MKFKEFDMRKEANKNMEYITPLILRKWIAEKIHAKHATLRTVFDPAVGSGQLFQFIKADKYIGVDINSNSLEHFKNNFVNSKIYQGNYFDTTIEEEYETVVSNYPFSLSNKDMFEVPPEELKEFFGKSITGKADFSFIIKSFLGAKDSGFYLCFP